MRAAAGESGQLRAEGTRRHRFGLRASAHAARHGRLLHVSPFLRDDVVAVHRRYASRDAVIVAITNHTAQTRIHRTRREYLACARNYNKCLKGMPKQIYSVL